LNMGILRSVFSRIWITHGLLKPLKIEKEKNFRFILLFSCRSSWRIYLTNKETSRFIIKFHENKKTVRKSFIFKAII
jgi:hypothetical protein